MSAEAAQEVVFTVPGEPVGKGRARAFRAGAGIRMHTPEKTARYENLVSMAAQKAMRGRAPIQGAVRMILVLNTTPPASWSNRKRMDALSGMIRPTSKPDLDNCLKAISDACNGIVFIDDKQICEVRIRREYSEIPGAHVVVEAL